MTWHSIALAVRSVMWAALLPGFFAGYLPWRYFGLRDVRLELSDPPHLVGLASITVGVILLAACIWEFATRGRGTLSPLDPPRQQVAVWREPECALERTSEMRLRNAADPRQTRDGPFLLRSCIHPVLRAQQTPKQSGILGSTSHRRTHNGSFNSSLARCREPANQYAGREGNSS